MGKTSNITDSIRNELVELLRHFPDQTASDGLREKVIRLVPAFRLLRELGVSLIPKKTAGSARDRILHYFKTYPLTVINGSELAVVSGISEWARRVRELRTQFGWSIASGTAAKQLFAEGEFPQGIDISAMKPEDYIMLDTTQDRDAALRWNTANQIRREQIGVRDKILKYMLTNVAKPITGEELMYLAKGRTEWARRVRELRTEDGWPIVTRNTGRPDLPVGVYVLESTRQSAAHDRHISDAVRSEVLKRDGYACQQCGWNQAQWSRSDPRHLELHHVVHHKDGGENTLTNLTTLCTVCHDVLHAKK